MGNEENKEKQNPKCPECGSKNIIGGGWMLTKKWGRRHRLKCNACASTFYESDKGERK